MWNLVGNNYAGHFAQGLHWILTDSTKRPATSDTGAGATYGETAIVAVTNFKGGAAKTTTAVHLAQYLALRGYRVLAVDLDSQLR